MVAQEDIERADPSESQPLLDPIPTTILDSPGAIERINPDDLSGVKNAEAWRQFHAAKKSAIGHLHQHLHDRGLNWARPGDPSQPGQAASPRERLIDDLDFLNHLVTSMHERMFQTMILGFLVALILASVIPIIGWFDSDMALYVLYMPFIGLLCGWLIPTGLYARYLGKLSRAIERLEERARENALEEGDRHCLDDGWIWWW